MAVSKFEQNSTNVFVVHTKEVGEYSKSPLQSQSNRFSPFKWWTYCGYYSLILPFRPIISDNGRCSLKTNTFQKFCSLGMLAFTWMYLILYLINAVTSFKQTTKLTAKNYFHLAFHVLRLVGSLNFHWILSKKRQEIEKLLINVGTGSEFKTTHKPPRWKMMGYAYLFVIALAIFLTRWAQIMTIYEFPSGIFNKSILTGRKYFAIFLENSNSTDVTTYGAADISLGVTSLVSELAFVYNRYFVSTLYSGIIPITFWLATKEFHAFIANVSARAETRSVTSVQKTILEEYDRLKRLTDSINSIWGGIYFAWVIERALTLMLVNDAVTSRNIWVIPLFVTEDIFPAISLILLADGCRITRNFTEWMSSPNVKKSYFIDAIEWEGLMRELDVNPISVGARGLYKITYGFLGQLIAVVITLFTISFD